MNKTAEAPQTLRDQIFKDVKASAPRSPRAELPTDEVVFPEVNFHCDGRVPKFPIVFVSFPGERIFGNQVSVEASSRGDRLRISLYEIIGSEQDIDVEFQKAQVGRSITIRSDRFNTPNWVELSRGSITVGSCYSEGNERCDDGLMIAVDPERTWRNWRAAPHTSDRIIRVMPFIFRPGWELAVSDDGKLLEPEKFQFVHTSKEIAEMLREYPELGFLTLEEQVQKLPVGARGVRLGYHPDHNDNPVKVELKGEEIVARFLYPDIPTLASRIKEGKLNPQVFLEKCLSPRALLGVPDVIELHIKSDKAFGKVGISLAIQRLDPTKPTKPIRVDSLPYLAPQLTTAGVDTDQFSAVLIDTLATPKGVGEIFASLNPEPEVVEQPRVVGGSANHSKYKEVHKGNSGRGSGTEVSKHSRGRTKKEVKVVSHASQAAGIATSKARLRQLQDNEWTNRNPGATRVPRRG